MQEEDRAVLIDADFMSSFLKIGKLVLIRDFFHVGKLYIPGAVFGELAKTNLIKDLLDEKFIQIERTEEKTLSGFSKDFENLGSGEKECIALCKQFKNALLLTSDKKATGIARKHGIAVLNIPAFLLACKNTAFLSNEEISLIIKELKTKDYYEFSADEKKRLLGETTQSTRTARPNSTTL